MEIHCCLLGLHQGQLNHGGAGVLRGLFLSKALSGLRWPVHPTIYVAYEADWEPFEISDKNPASASVEESPAEAPQLSKMARWEKASKGTRAKPPLT